MSMPYSFCRPVNASDVNCAPWSKLKISGVPKFRNTFFRASTQKSTSMVFDSL